MDSTNIAQIKINDKLVTVEKNENDHYRGLHVVIFDPYKGVVLKA